MSILNAVRRHPGKIIAVFVVGLIFVALIEAIAYARGTAHRAMCNSNLKQIGLALHNYHDTYNCFPPAVTYGPDGKPWHSWRVLIMPFIECGSFYSEYSFDEPWNAPHNAALAKTLNGRVPPVYRCPTDPESASENTSYVAVIGENTMWPPHGMASFRDAKDGTSRTLNVVEVAASGVHWMEPRDLRLDAMSFHINAAKGVGIRGNHGGSHFILPDVPTGANAGTVDGWVEFLDAETPPENVRGILQIDDGKPAPVEAEIE